MKFFTGWIDAWLTAYRARQYHRRLAASRLRQQGLLATLLTRVVPHEPYQYRTTLSFLQPSGALDLLHPITVDLFLPELPLVIDLLSPADVPRYGEARAFTDRAAWDRRMEELAWKRARLTRYGCPYLTLLPDEPIDLPSLKAQVRTLTGR